MLVKVHWILPERPEKYPLSGCYQSQDELHSIEVRGTKSITIQAALGLEGELAARWSLPIIDTVNAALTQLHDIRTKQKEYFVVLYLNARKQLIEKVSLSGLSTKH